MSAVIVIPARYDSTRFPGKPIAPLKGKPVIQYVYENSKSASLADDVIVATDSETIFKKVLSFGGKALMTSKAHLSGTDRVAEAARSLSCDIIVNVQADEPMIQPEMVDAVISLLSDRRADIGTLVKRIREPEEVINSNVVKAVFDPDGFALYFSRAQIPYHRDLFSAKVPKCQSAKDNTTSGLRDLGTSELFMFKHIGIYSYRRDVLLRFAAMRPSRLEEIEKLEQLRALENGFRIKVREIAVETIGVDTPQDLERVEKWLSLSS